MATEQSNGAGGAGGAPTARRRFPRPIRDFLATHDLHLIPHRVPHSQRARRTAAIVVVGLMAASGYWWFIPRAEATLEAQYHEGLFNAIAVDLRVVNGGTVSLSALHVELVVTDLSTNASVGFTRLNTTLAPHATLDLEAVNFKGDQVRTSYGISVTMSFDAGSGRETKSFDFRTEEPFMNLYFRQRVV